MGSAVRRTFRYRLFIKDNRCSGNRSGPVWSAHPGDCHQAVRWRVIYFSPGVSSIFCRIGKSQLFFLFFSFRV